MTLRYYRVVLMDIRTGAENIHATRLTERGAIICRDRLNAKLTLHPSYGGDLIFAIREVKVI